MGYDQPVGNMEEEEETEFCKLNFKFQRWSYLIAGATVYRNVISYTIIFSEM
jgi:hypothetical protein